MENNQQRYISFDAINNRYNYQIGVQTAFKRSVSIEFIDPNEIKINSIVKWSGRGGGKFEINLEDYFLIGNHD